MTPNNPSKLLAVFVSAGVLVIGAGRSEASLARAASFDDKVANAESIVLGKCIRTESKFDAEHRWILTYSTFQVEQSIKGQPGQEVTVVTPGGRVGSLHQDSIGVPAFTKGDEKVIFTKSTALGPTVLYFDQGAYDVEQQGSERIIKPVASEVVRVDTQRGVAVPAEEPRTLSDFRTAVASSIRDRAAHQMEMVKERKQDQSSIVAVLQRNKLLVALALAGVLLATWQLLRR